MGSLAFILARERPLTSNVLALANRFVRLDILNPSRVFACLVSRSSLFECIKASQYDDLHLLVLRDTVQHSDAKEVTIGDDDGLWELILEEAYSSRYSIHPGAAKMYHDLKQHYWWRMMKKDIIELVAR
ncbi:uncharacterized protein [Nicotiana tomentosiformis]|uniref:uncharacterized protein n=1 Tax=Nicotiana tomentosiformis TaxID=4098 RepID=UPI00388CB738